MANGGNCLGKFIYPKTHSTIHNWEVLYSNGLFSFFLSLSFRFWNCVWTKYTGQLLTKNYICWILYMRCAKWHAYAYAFLCRSSSRWIPYKSQHVNTQFNFHSSISVNMNIHNAMKLIIMLEMFCDPFWFTVDRMWSQNYMPNTKNTAQCTRATDIS